MKKQILIPLLLALPLLAGAAQAQRFETQQIYERMTRLERDINLLQRQAAQGGVAVGGAPGVIGNAGQMGAEIARIDEEMRSLRGQVEQANYEAEQVKKQMAKMQKDMDFRFRELENKAMAAAAPAPVATEEDAAPEASNQLPKDLSGELETVVRGQPEGSLALPKKGAPLSARDLYNHAFKLLNQTDYKGAETAFLQFTRDFGDDPLVGNAWYWLGEAYYVQRDYVKSSDSFRQGYEKLPDGPKAGDNLLKLAMSLSALERGKEACIVLKQVDKKFSANSEALRNKARQEISRLGCK